MRGFFEIGIYYGKHTVNVGTLWRSAYQLGASGIFTIGNRYKRQCSDTPKSHRHIPLRHYDDFDDFNYHRPFDTLLVGVEIGGAALREFNHPNSCIYLLGAEDYGLPQEIIRSCDCVLSIESINTPSFNVAVAGSIVMYDRLAKSL